MLQRLWRWDHGHLAGKTQGLGMGVPLIGWFAGDNPIQIYLDTFKRMITGLPPWMGTSNLHNIYHLIPARYGEAFQYSHSVGWSFLLGVNI